MKSMLGGLGGVAALPYLANAEGSGIFNVGPMTNGARFSVDNPYAGIQWDKIEYVPSASHIHVENQSKLDKVYSHFGLRHIPISNYYPAAPYYPAKEIRENHFGLSKTLALFIIPIAPKKARKDGRVGNIWKVLLIGMPSSWIKEQDG